MKLMIDISDSTYEAIMAWNRVNASWPLCELITTIKNGTPIPDNATNCKSIKCETCTNHNYCDYESKEVEGDKE